MFPCQNTLLPTTGSIVNSYNSLYNEDQGLLAFISKKWPLSASNPFFNDLEVPEIEFDKKATYLVQEYHGLVMSKILEILRKVIPVDVTVKIYEFTINVVKLFTDKDYIQSFKQVIANNIDKFSKLIPNLYCTYYDKFSVNSPAIQVENIWSYIVSFVNDVMLKTLFKIFKALINTFNTLWNSLNLPSIPDPSSFNIEEVLGKIVNDTSRTIKDKIQALEELSFAGYKLKDILGDDVQERVTSPERTLDRYVTAFRDFAVAFPKKILLDWIGRIANFLNALGLGEIIKWATLTFCAFLQMIGLPTS